jgi:NAD+ synthase
MRRGRVTPRSWDLPKWPKADMSVNHTAMITTRLIFSRGVLELDVARVADDIASAIREQVLGTSKRRGAVVGMSGGIDSSVVAALCARALGPERVFGLLMPERDSSGDALRLGTLLANHLGIPLAVEDIAPALEGLGCYARQLEAIRMVVPEYGDGWRCKLTLPPLLEGERLAITSLTVADPEGRLRSTRMPLAAYLQMVAATNFKQRTRKMMEYYHADRLNYCVAGTPNRLEYELGFFVKQGDGAADFKPIAHLYKTQVFALAAHLGVPAEIRERTPTTDTFSLAQTQEEFYFALPYREMDLCLWAYDHGTPAAEAAPVLGLTEEQVDRVYRDIEAKRRVSRYLHQQPLLVREGQGA